MVKTLTKKLLLTLMCHKFTGVISGFLILIVSFYKLFRTQKYCEISFNQELLMFWYHFACNEYLFDLTKTETLKSYANVSYKISCFVTTDKISINPEFNGEIVCGIFFSVFVCVRVFIDSIFFFYVRFSVAKLE